ncbi:palmitoyltransferase ZDHHC12 isoform X2 [Ornithorhynchus anatinus]|uniref:palmitoyltransferase ZDHHC12 isoform X2 n=1 Tax=Ornithorhynchus anatinus TaxID=9258 RepID=UPI0010A7A499|nr:palmitoyltransferase ZDHHC12 isoform X2 [Ornithorhynchus anatinus]
MGARAGRWSGLLVRGGHTVLSWGLTLLLFLHRTELRQQEAHGELLQPLLFVLLVLCSVLLYFAVSLMDPGYVGPEPAPHAQASTSEELKAMVPQKPPTIHLRRCGYCLLKPLRARHCRSCKRCVRRYDHHCPWIENCVGERNHPLFVAYLALQLVVLVWALRLAWSGISFEQPWGAWLRHTGLLFAAFLLLAVFSAVVALLLASHLYLVSCDTTTWEFMSPHRISYLRRRSSSPFDRGLLRNLGRFFCGCEAVAWEMLYTPEDGEPV